MATGGAERAVVEAAKVRDYLLSDVHPIGRFKATFFTTLGYSASHWEALAQDLRNHLAKYDAVPAGLNAFGQKYVVRGIIEGPTGKAVLLVSVWIVRHDEDFPRFVTAFPGTKP